MGLFGKKKENKAAEETRNSSCSCGCNAEVHDEAKAEASGSSQISIKVLGSGCKNCQALLQNTKEAVSALNLPADVEYITDMKEVAKYDVMSMPALVVNEQVVSMGKVLKPAEVQKLMQKIGIA